MTFGDYISLDQELKSAIIDRCCFGGHVCLCQQTPLAWDRGAINAIEHRWLAPEVQWPESLQAEGHADAEALIYVLDGTLALVNAADAISVGKGGVLHLSNCLYDLKNPSELEAAEFIRIVFERHEGAFRPSCDGKCVVDYHERRPLHLIAASAGCANSMTLQSEAEVYTGTVDAGDALWHEFAPGRLALLWQFRFAGFGE